MKIFIDNSKDELESAEAVVQYFKASFEGVKDDSDIWRIFKMEDVLKQLDEKLDDFVALRQEVREFSKELKIKYLALDLPETKEVAFLTEKIKVAYLDIILN